uniref:Uncharacterized protein n=1 Tax=uncultured marine group II/III euryarchaeote SAT1000_18_B12 TaxID=1456563 RepID=A0A075I6S4_9EURY|nr:hypothetical protein [uncultured marine group II/III euryarchaeote SAT1000_18_B12]
MELLHRHLTRFIAIDVLLLIVLLTTMNTSGSSSILVFYMLLGLVLIPLGIVSVISMLKRSSGGINLGIASLGFIGAAFLLLGVLGGISYLTGESKEILLPAVLILLGASTLKKIPTMKNPSYDMWYRGANNSQLSGNEFEQEVLATCPSCHSVLAVFPNQLTINDKCPNCSERLVYSEEE